MVLIRRGNHEALYFRTALAVLFCGIRYVRRSKNLFLGVVMMGNCYGCFKPAIDADACTKCKYARARRVLESTGITLPEDVGDEIIFEVFSKMESLGKEEVLRMERSGLIALIEKCSDTASFLGKKRYDEVDELKSLIFDLERNEVFITNGDVVIRISDLPYDMLDGLSSDLPVYDYIQEKFVPNSTPFNTEEMAGTFQDGFVFNITLPVMYLLKSIHTAYRESLQRRSHFAVIDVGYSCFEGSVIIPRLEIAENGTRFFKLPDGRMVVPLKGGKLPNESLELNTSYVAFPVSVDDNIIKVDVYKKYDETTTVGMYNSVMVRLSDDMHPYDLVSYSEHDLIRFKLYSEVDEFNDPETKMRAYKNFRPVVMELEYLYLILLLFASFGIEKANMYVKDPNLPVTLEGIRTIEGQPLIEAVSAIVAIGEDGNQCEEIIAGSVGG